MGMGEIRMNAIHPVSEDFLERWQKTLDVAAAILQVPAALIMRVWPQQIEVLVSSASEGNPYEEHEKADLGTGLYCETVMATRAQLLVPNALDDPDWCRNPDVKLNMISYLGIPLIWPDGSVFGTICVLDSKTRHFPELHQSLLGQFKSVIEGDFRLIHQSREISEAYAAAEAANRAKSRFIANVSHEIRTPLNAVLGLTHLLRSHAEPRQLDQLDKIQGAGQHLLSIVNNILDLAKIDAGKLELDKKDFEVADLFEAVKDIVSHGAAAKETEVLLDFAACPPFLNGDETRLRQALLNFASNAVKFTQGGAIFLRAVPVESDGSSALIRFEVVDTGAGIDAATLARLFAPFEQGGQPAANHGGGTGLGLVIVKGLATLMGGEAGATSRLGHGSTFWFTARLGLCRTLAQPDLGSAMGNIEETLRRTKAGKRVLLVEDNPINQEVALELLRNVGLEVDLAEDGIQAIERTQANLYDIVLMDVLMPNMDGLEATKVIRTLPNGRDFPILAMTANAFEEDKRACETAGMDDFIVKPIDPDALYASLYSWL